MEIFAPAMKVRLNSFLHDRREVLYMEEIEFSDSFDAWLHGDNFKKQVLSNKRLSWRSLWIMCSTNHVLGLQLRLLIFQFSCWSL